MAITMKLTVNFPLSIVVSKETLEDFKVARERAREILAAAEVPKMHGETKYRVELLASDKTDEECLEVIFRQGIREFVRDDLVKEIASTEARVRVGDIKVTYEKPMEPKGSCQGCIYDDCKQESNRSANAGCAFKQTGIRSPHFETRFEKTV